MSHTQIIRKQILKSDLTTVWEFICSPSNLEKITPKSMSFNITSHNKDEEMYAGMIITYKVTPVLNIPMNWMTEITQVKEKKFFVDEQRQGPYKMWHHQHLLEEVKEGILMTDIITYIPPFGFIGKIANFIFIQKKINQIFNYRYQALEKKFNS